MGIEYSESKSYRLSSELYCRMLWLTHLIDLYYTYIAVSFYRSHTLHLSSTCFPVSFRPLSTSTHILVETRGVRKRKTYQKQRWTIASQIFSPIMSSPKVIHSVECQLKKSHIKSIPPKNHRISKLLFWRSFDPCYTHQQKTLQKAGSRDS